VIKWDCPMNGPPEPHQRVIRSYDPRHQYQCSSKGLEPTHLMFANAKQDHALHCFIERFGPVVAASYKETDDGVVLWQCRGFGTFPSKSRSSAFRLGFHEPCGRGVHGRNFPALTTISR
jgi:hypothetical protein